MAARANNIVGIVDASGGQETSAVAAWDREVEVPEPYEVAQFKNHLEPPGNLPDPAGQAVGQHPGRPKPDEECDCDDDDDDDGFGDDDDGSDDDVDDDDDDDDDC